MMMRGENDEEVMVNSCVKITPGNRLLATSGMRSAY
jgi:hypothetical protein